MVVVRMVQMVADHEIGVVAVRDRFVPAVRPMDVPGLVAGAAMVGCAALGVDVVRREQVLVDVVDVRVVKVAIVQVVDVVTMNDRGMAAVRTVDVVVSAVSVMGHGSRLPGPGRIA